MGRVLVPLPERDFDPTEVAVPWRYLTAAGHEVVFATELGTSGPVPACDPLLLTGVLAGRLGAAPEPKAFYAEMAATGPFRAPAAFESLRAEEFDGLLLGGGHAPGMRPYLESTSLRRLVAAFWATNRPVAAICHGVLVLARTTDGAGRSVLAQRFSTCLPKYMEQSAYLLTAWKLGRYYRTYDTYVEDEVVAALGDRSRFLRGHRTAWRRGTATDDSPAFAARDANYLSARWPGDAYLFARTFTRMLEGG